MGLNRVSFLSRCLVEAFKVHSSGCVVAIDPLRLVLVLQEPGWVFRQAGVPHRVGAGMERCPCGTWRGAGQLCAGLRAGQQCLC